MTEKKPGIRLQLWLRKSDGRIDDPEWYVRDVASLDDPYQRDRFNGRTISELDKFIEGIFLTDQELKDHERRCYYQGREHGGENVKDIERRHEAELREAFMAGAEYDFRYYGDPENPGIEPYPRYETYEDYQQSKAKERGE